MSERLKRINDLRRIRCYSEIGEGDYSAYIAKAAEFGISESWAEYGLGENFSLEQLGDILGTGLRTYIEAEWIAGTSSLDMLKGLKETLEYNAPFPKMPA
jgi:hypothetical protein